MPGNEHAPTLWRLLACPDVDDTMNQDVSSALRTDSGDPSTWSPARIHVDPYLDAPQPYGDGCITHALVDTSR